MARFRIIAAVLLLTGSAAFGIAAGQLDDFEDGTTENWIVGLPDQGTPTNVASGGPDGANDAYMLHLSTGQFGPLGKMVVLNRSQWLGDYTAAGVVAMQLHLRNFGDDALQMRIALIGDGGVMVTQTPFALPADGEWHHAEFPINASALVGAFDPDATLANVTEMRLLHATSVNHHGDELEAMIGVDNVLAVSAPPPFTLTGAVSRKIHDAVGPLDLELLATCPGAIEPRVSGVTQLILSFSDDPDPSASCADLFTNNVTCMAVTVSGGGMIIDLNDSAPNILIGVDLGGLMSSAGAPYTGASEVIAGNLLGDCSGDGVVNIVDLNCVKQGLFSPVNVSRLRQDVNADGVINIVDLSMVKGNLFSTLPECPAE